MSSVAAAPALPAQPGAFGLSSVKEEEEVLDVEEGCCGAGHGSPSSADSGGFKGPISLVKSGLDTTDSDTDSSPRMGLRSPPNTARLPEAEAGRPERQSAQAEREKERGLQGKWFRGGKGRRGEREAAEDGAPPPSQVAPRGTAGTSWTAKMIKASMLQSKSKSSAAHAETSEGEATSGPAGPEQPGPGRRHFGVTMLLRQWQGSGAADSHRPQTAPSHGRVRKELRDSAPAAGAPLAEVWARMRLEEMAEEDEDTEAARAELPWEHCGLGKAQGGSEPLGMGAPRGWTGSDSAQAKDAPVQGDKAEASAAVHSLYSDAADVDASSHAGQGALPSADRRRRKLGGRPGTASLLEGFSNGVARPRTAPGKRGASSTGPAVGMPPEAQDGSRGRRAAGLGLGSLALWHTPTGTTAAAMHGVSWRSSASEAGPQHPAQDALGQHGAPGLARAKIGRSVTVEGDVAAARVVAEAVDARLDVGALPRPQIWRSTSINSLSRPDLGCGPHLEEAQEGQALVRQAGEFRAGRSISVHEDTGLGRSGMLRASNRAGMQDGDHSHLSHAPGSRAPTQATTQDDAGLPSGRDALPSGLEPAQDPMQRQHRSRSQSVNAFTSKEGGQGAAEPLKPKPEQRAPPPRVRSVSTNSGSASAPRVPNHIREAPFAVERMHQWLETQSKQTRQPGSEGPAGGMAQAERRQQHQQLEGQTNPGHRMRATTMNDSHFYPPLMVPGSAHMGVPTLPGFTGLGAQTALQDAARLDQKAPAMSLVRSHSINSAGPVLLQPEADSATLLQLQAPLVHDAVAKVPRTSSVNSIPSVQGQGGAPTLLLGAQAQASNAPEGGVMVEHGVQEGQSRSQGLSATEGKAESASPQPPTLPQRGASNLKAELAAPERGVSSQVPDSGRQEELGRFMVQAGSTPEIAAAMGQSLERGPVGEAGLTKSLEKEPKKKDMQEKRDSVLVAARTEARRESGREALSSGSHKKRDAGKVAHGEQGTASPGLFLQRFLVGPMASRKKLSQALQQVEGRAGSAEGEPLLGNGSDSLAAQASPGDRASAEGLRTALDQSTRWSKSKKGLPPAASKPRDEGKPAAVQRAPPPGVRAPEEDAPFKIQQMLLRQRALSIRASDFSQAMAGSGSMQGGGAHVHSRTLSDVQGSQGNARHAAGQPQLRHTVRTQSLHSSSRLERSDSDAVRDAKRALQRGGSGNGSAGGRGPKAALGQNEKPPWGHGHEASRPRTAGGDRASSTERAARHKAPDAHARPRTAVPRSTTMESLSSPRTPRTAQTVSADVKLRADADGGARRMIPRSITEHSHGIGVQGGARCEPADNLQQFSEGLVKGSSRKLLVRSDSSSVFRDQGRVAGGSEGAQAQAPRRGVARETVPGSRGSLWGQGEDVHSKVQGREEGEAPLKVQGAVPSAWSDQPDWVARLSGSRSSRANSAASTSKALPPQTKSKDAKGASGINADGRSAAIAAQTLYRFSPAEAGDAMQEAKHSSAGEGDGGRDPVVDAGTGTASGHGHNGDSPENQSRQSSAADPPAEAMTSSEEPVRPAHDGLWKLQGLDSSGSAAELDTFSAASPMADASTIGSPQWSIRSSPARHTSGRMGVGQEVSLEVPGASPGRTFMEEPFQAPSPGPRFRSKKIMWGPPRKSVIAESVVEGGPNVAAAKEEGRGGRDEAGREEEEGNRPAAGGAAGEMASTEASGDLGMQGSTTEEGHSSMEGGGDENQQVRGEDGEEILRDQEQTTEHSSQVPMGAMAGEAESDNAGGNALAAMQDGEAESDNAGGNALAAMQDGEAGPEGLVDRNNEAPTSSPGGRGLVDAVGQEPTLPRFAGVWETGEMVLSMGDAQPEAGAAEGLSEPGADEGEQVGVTLDAGLGRGWEDGQGCYDEQMMAGSPGQGGMQEQDELIGRGETEPRSSRLSIETPEVFPVQASAEHGSPGILFGSHGESMEGVGVGVEQESDSWSPRESMSEETWDRRPIPLTPALLESQWCPEGSSAMDVSDLDLQGSSAADAGSTGAAGSAEERNMAKSALEGSALGSAVPAGKIPPSCAASSEESTIFGAAPECAPSSSEIAAEDAAVGLMGGSLDAGLEHVSAALEHPLEEPIAGVELRAEETALEGASVAHYGIQGVLTKEGGMEEHGAEQGGMGLLARGNGSVEEASLGTDGAEAGSRDEDVPSGTATGTAMAVGEVDARAGVIGDRVDVDSEEDCAGRASGARCSEDEQTSEDEVEEEDGEEEEEYNYWQEYMQTKEAVRPGQGMQQEEGGAMGRDEDSPHSNGSTPGLERLEESKSLGGQGEAHVAEFNQAPQMEPVPETSMEVQEAAPALAPAVLFAGEEAQGGREQGQSERAHAQQKKALRLQLQHLLLLQLQQLQAQLMEQEEGEGQGEQMLQMLLQIQQQMQLNAQLLKGSEY